MVRHCVSALALLVTSSFCQDISSQPPATFDVASVRPSGPNMRQHSNVPLDSGNIYSTIDTGEARNAAGGFLMATHQPLWRYIVFAYHLSPTQEMALRFSFFSGVPKSGAPFWVTGSFDASPEFFDIEARTSPGTSIDQMRLMMQSLLAERFHLAVHFVTADAPVFALTLIHPGATGPNLQPHPASDICTAGVPSLSASSVDRVGPSPGTPSSGVGSLPPICGVVAHVPSSVPGQHFGGRAVPLSLIATSMPTMTGLAAIPRPVVDQTGLTGLYDFTLHWVHKNSAVSTPSTSDESIVSDNIAAFHEALKKQLGLQLKPAHAPIPFLIVDHVDHPAAN